MEYGGSTPFSTPRVPVSVVKEVPVKALLPVEWAGFLVSPELKW
jgi:hypothetical protein